MTKVTIYTAGLCGYCSRAKRILDQKQIEYEEIDVTFSPEERARMRDRANGRNTVPQIFIDDIHIGGSEELMALDLDGKLDELLQNN